ncbi:DUF6531 domain-containing protein [Aquimarina latercula]|uniref:DUF6531 domain-containing protein n=1 Tax=Aquimarina latercula TaxID=987 RepID=UPI000410F5BB|nr:DUF6531 domain-containing protein [Aquimarina latercula]
MLLASKHFTPVIGIDIHIIIVPPGVPIPIPHPYIGMVIDPMDYVPIIGSTVNVNCVPKGNSGTAGMIGTVVHIPMGGPFAMAPMIGHDSMNFFGSTKVSVEDAYFTPAGYMTMTCNDIGMPLSLTPGKKMKPIPSLYLPSSMSVPLPMGKPVNVGGPYAPDLMGMLMALVMSYGFGALMKGAGKGLTKLNHKVLKKFPATQGLSKKMCKMGFEPVDLITGRMVYEGEDFSIAGPIPIRWERNWYSDSGYEGMMGHGMHCNYDLSLHVDFDEDSIVMRLPDGRITSFPMLLTENETSYNRTEKLTLTFIDGSTYEVIDNESQQTYTFKKYTNTLYKPTNLKNPEGFEIQFIYNAVYKLEQIIDTAGRRIDLDLNEENKITKVSATHQGETRTLVKYSYNEEGDLIEIIDALDQKTVMEYENHLMIKKTDRNGQAFYWEYDGKKTGAKCIRTWGDGGILSGTIEYNKGYNVITNSLDQESIYYFNNQNLCTQVTDPMGDHIFHEYTPYMEPYRDIDEEGNITGYSYDDRGNLIGLHQPDGSVIGFVYDEKDRLVLTKDPAGGSVVKTFENDRLHAVIGLDGGVTSFEYNNQGLIQEVRDNAGNRTFLNYDEDHNLNKLTLPNNAESTWEYDPWGRCLHTKNSEDHQQQFFYDELDRIYQIRQADNNLIKLKYNAYDEIIQTIDQKKREVNFDYTPMGSLKMREENSRKVYFKYDTEEQLNTITNEHNEYYRFSRNEKGEIIREIGFDGLTRKYNRDRAGKVLKVNRPDDKYTEYEYDFNGRITRAEHSDGTWETYSYDLNGNLIEAVNENSRVQLIRDTAGRIIAENQDGHLVESEYDSLSNRTNITSSLGANIALTRNKLGLVEKINASNLSQTEESTKAWNAQFAHNSLGMEVERMLPGGIINHIEYDQAGRPIQHKVTAGNREMRHRTYTWNVNDRLTKMVDQLTNGTVAYGYDEFNNLAGARYENKQFDYKLPDEVGNLYRTEGKGDRKYGTGGQLLEANRNKFKYDAEGNLITKISATGTFEYSWYGNGMLRSVTDPKNNTTQFEYDALGRRTVKIKHTKGFSPSQGEMSTTGRQRGSITRFVWDGNVPLHEWSYDLKDRPELVVDEFGMLAESKPEPIENLITWVFDEGTFKPAAKITPEDSYSIITDYLGTPVEMYNSKGEKTWQVEYDIYGKVRKLVKGSLNDCPFRYQGQYEDVETGLYYNRFRYYTPDEGVYITKDPIGLAGNNPNLYAYVSNTTKYVDIFGCNMFNPITWTAPSASQGGTGYTYKIFQQDIDWDLPVNTRNGTKTNLELAEMGRSPFVVKDGKYEIINLHHSNQNAKGPLFELSAATHQQNYGTNALHPHLPEKHPHNPTDHKKFGVDREAYWKERASKERANRAKTKVKCN